jgi:hypothetical protein
MFTRQRQEKGNVNFLHRIVINNRRNEQIDWLSITMDVTTAAMCEALGGQRITLLENGIV